MQHTFGGMPRARRANAGPPRFTRVSVRESTAAEMLQGCPVVTADGEPIGQVEHLMIDVRTHQLRYVILSCGDQCAAEIAVPWKALYFDSATARLVFYTMA